MKYIRHYLSLTQFTLFSMIVGCFISTTANNASAQTTAKLEPLSVEQYNEIKKLQFKDLDKDTYMKSPAGLVADRLDMKPPYVFNFSDGAERRIYMFKIADAKTKADLSLLAVYKNIKSGKIVNVCVPSAAASKQIWGLYIDDLKEADKSDFGMVSCLSFVLSRELATTMGGAAGGDSSKAGKEDEYEFCFPSNSLVTLKTGEQKEISSVKTGDFIETANKSLSKKTYTKVKKLVVHTNQNYTITQISLADLNITASMNGEPSQILNLEATPNHPVVTQNGVKKVKELQVNDIMFYYDNINNTIKTLEIVNLLPNFKTVSKVYNLETDNDTYFVNGLLVKKK